MESTSPPPKRIWSQLVKRLDFSKLKSKIIVVYQISAYSLNCFSYLKGLYERLAVFEAVFDPQRSQDLLHKVVSLPS